MVIHSSTKWHAPDTLWIPGVLDWSYPVTEVPTLLLQHTPQLQVLSTHQTLKVGKVTIGGQARVIPSVEQWMLWGWVSAQEGPLCALLFPTPPSARSAGYLKICHGRTLHHGKWQKLQMSGFICLFFPESQLLNVYQLVTGDHVSVSELLVLRKNLLILWRRNSTASCTNRYLLLCERNTYTSYSASSFQSF